MKNVGGKPETLRRAVACASFYAPRHCLERIANRDTEKGDPQATARIAGIMAAKRTDSILPLCHPMPLQHAEVEFEVAETCVHVTATVETIASTGVEMEALTAASVAALTLYDMLKPYCEPRELTIGECRLLSKIGGKSQFKRHLSFAVSAAVLVLSDTVAAGKKPDTAGRSVADALQSAGFEPVDYRVLADDAEQITRSLQAHIDAGIQLVITVGGTGLGPRDITVDCVQPLIDTAVPGLMEAARSFGQRRTPFAMLSRGVAGFSGDSLLVTFPGSRKGAQESIAALLPGLVHLFAVRRDQPHAHGYE